MSKNEKDWFTTLAGEKVVGMDSKTRLEARLVRTILKERADEINNEINKEINKDDGRLRKALISKLEKEGYLKKESTNLEQKIKDKPINSIVRFLRKSVIFL